MVASVVSLFRKFCRYLPFGCFVMAVLCLCFVYGIAVGKWHVFPHNFLKAGWDSLKRLKDKGRTPEFLSPAVYEKEGVDVCLSEQVCPGVTLVTGYWKEGENWDVGIHLIDSQGNILHKWCCNPRDIWSTSPHQDVNEPYIVSEKKTYVHGTLLLPNGEVIFNLEYFGLVKLNSKSEVIWKLPYRTHHSIFQDDDGSIWVCGIRLHGERVPELPGMKPPFREDTILNVSLEGVVKHEISILEKIYESDYHGLLRSYTHGVLHLNDVEVLSHQKANAFDLFEVGDIMVSMRTINTVFVIDGETERIKWSLTYPFGAQHDPDFTDDGYITVFDNHMNQRFRPSERRGSRIVRIEPSTRKAMTLYGWKENQYFFTHSCGKHQHLPNENILITESVPGRVFEINRNGEVVWSWVAPRWNKNLVPTIQEGTRYGAEYANFTNVKRREKK